MERQHDDQREGGAQGHQQEHWQPLPLHHDQVEILGRWRLETCQDQVRLWHKWVLQWTVQKVTLSFSLEPEKRDVGGTYYDYVRNHDCYTPEFVVFYKPGAGTGLGWCLHFFPGVGLGRGWCMRFGRGGWVEVGFAPGCLEPGKWIIIKISFAQILIKKSMGLVEVGMVLFKSRGLWKNKIRMSVGWIGRIQHSVYVCFQ